eukprot:TRINITY_DN1036_c0_g1_i1.p1 TRINITY_DN1036_c0_g1~~TRINITY_DN1036_c0_g1_i1.p1  ORF type:complete len:1171 (-),score=389.08 TRINITY_DN1036_c0_g1_i1:347-3823(-)
MPVTRSVDGNQACSHVAYALSETAFLFPITPATTMGELTDNWAEQGRKNIFGQQVSVSQMQSECGVAGAVHGACTSGSLVATFTSSQGLLLMIPDMFKISGELLPCVIHVASRVVGTQAISIYVEHNDVMATRTTGFAIINSHSVQEAADMALVSHLTTIQSQIPFLHFFDGFRTSHEIVKAELPTNEEIAELVDMSAVDRQRARALNPTHPMVRGTIQSNEIYFQNQERNQEFYNAVPDIVEKNMRLVEKKFGRSYHIFDYVGHPEAEFVTVVMGSGAQTVEEALPFINNDKFKCGVLKVHLFRPWSAKHFLAAIPKTVKRIAVLDRVKEYGADGEPLFKDVCSCYMGEENAPLVIGGRFGLGGKEFTPACVKAVYDNLLLPKPKKHFTVGINDDICHSSLPMGPEFNALPAGTTECMFWGIGADGTVGANHDAIKIIGDNTPMHVQGFFAYGAHKSGGLTLSHLRFGAKPFKAQYLIKQADYLACHCATYVKKYRLLRNIREGGIFVLNSNWTLAEMEAIFPGSLKRDIANKKARFYNIDASSIAEKVGLGKRINTVMQAVFFQLSGVLEFNQAVKLLEDAVRKTYSTKGDKIINMNISAIKAAKDALVQVEVPASWKDAPLEPRMTLPNPTDFVNNSLIPTMLQEGDELPVSNFEAGGPNPLGLSKYEKRGVSAMVSKWNVDKCVGCLECATLCPHAVIRPFLLTDEEKAKSGLATIAAKGKNAGLNLRMQISPMDCTSCEVCTHACRYGALTMAPFLEEEKEKVNWDYCVSLPNRAGKVPRNTLLGSQLYQPLLEFSGACDGCCETAYVKLLTQMFGERMVVANASGCSSVWGGTWGMVPYTTNSEGHGPAWSNSLYEENAEFGYGMAKANFQRRDLLKQQISKLDAKAPADVAELAKQWTEAMNDAEKVAPIANQLIRALEKPENKSNPALKDIYFNRDVLPLLSHWAIGGDGWAYDINYGGLDHVIAQGFKINILVLDTEMYSNTGGQKSKASNIGAIAKFASGGVRKQKKDLGMIAIQYKDVYVASISLQANPNQALRAIQEAEAYPGTSLLIAYSPCKEHGFPMSQSIEEAKLAVSTGYWPLYRYDPRKTPAMQVDSGKVEGEVKDFLMRENRYAALARAQPEVAEQLQGKLAEGKKKGIEILMHMAEKK